MYTIKIDLIKEARLWTEFKGAQEGDQWQTVLNMLINLRRKFFLDLSDGGLVKKGC